MTLGLIVWISDFRFLSIKIARNVCLSLSKLILALREAS